MHGIRGLGSTACTPHLIFLGVPSPEILSSFNLWPSLERFVSVILSSKPNVILHHLLGEKCSVSSPNSAFDFTTPKPIGQDIDKVPGGGYDHTYCLPQSKEFCAE